MSILDKIGEKCLREYLEKCSRFVGIDVEVAVKSYKAGEKEAAHFHKIATEYTVIIKGSVKMNGEEYNAGSILTIHPLESTDFYAITDVITAVVKIPGASNDKYKI